MAKIPTWEQAYRNAQLTPMILLALRDGPKDATVVRYYIEDMTNFLLEYNQTSVYRTLRRLEQAGLLKARFIAQATIPAAKIYALSKRGNDQLQGFIDRAYTWR